jgi:hypothetical protein
VIATTFLLRLRSQAERPVVVWNRGADKCEALKAEFGDLVTVAASPAEVLAATYSPRKT